MKLKKLTLTKLPGLERSFEIADLSDGLNVIIGPNASGKTSICQAVRRLLWPNVVKCLLYAEIHSEWVHDSDHFTIAVKEGLPLEISQSGQGILRRLPDESFLSCFSMTIDELFDGRDLDFAQKIAREIAGGCDLTVSYNALIPNVNLRSTFREWESASTLFKEYRQNQEQLRKEEEEFPELEERIQQAEKAREDVFTLEKILALKTLKEKISAYQGKLNAFPKQLHESRIEPTDWANYEQLSERIQQFQKVNLAVEKSIRSVGWIITGVSLLWILFSLFTYKNFVFSSLILIPLGYVWTRIFRSEKRHQEKIDRDKMELDSLEHKLSQLLMRTECFKNPEALRPLVDQYLPFQRLQSDLNNVQRQFADAVKSVEKRDLSRIDEEREILAREKKGAENRAESLKDLYEKKGRLRVRLQEINPLKEEGLLEAQEETFASLRQACLDLVRKEILQMLVHEVQQEFQRDYQPPVLEQAAIWFGKFTQHKFRLEAPMTDTGSLVYEVIDTSTGERKSLDRLSRGTRMQLLLSIRLSFAWQCGKKQLFPPLFLDEVLANTDPERFDEVAKVIDEITASGKQVFYLTCNPEDAWKWKRCCLDANLIDLGKIRKGQAFLAAPLSIQKEKIPKPPHQDFFAYVQELKLPSFRIDEPLEMLSIHYLVNRVNDLYRFLESGIETFGNLIHLRKDLLYQGFPDSANFIKKREQLLHRFYELKIKGRGKPLSRHVLIDGGLSKIFIDRIWEIAKELNCNAKNLIVFLEDKTKKDERKKGLRVEDREALKIFLLQHGYLDERSILTDNEIVCELLPLTAEEEDQLFIKQLLLSLSMTT